MGATKMCRDPSFIFVTKMLFLGVPTLEKHYLIFLKISIFGLVRPLPKPLLQKSPKPSQTHPNMSQRS